MTTKDNEAREELRQVRERVGQLERDVRALMDLFNLQERKLDKLQGVVDDLEGLDF